MKHISVVSVALLSIPFFSWCAASKRSDSLRPPAFTVPTVTPSPDPASGYGGFPFKRTLSTPSSQVSDSPRSPLYDAAFFTVNQAERIEVIREFYRCGVVTSPSRLQRSCSTLHAGSNVCEDGRSRASSDASGYQRKKDRAPQFGEERSVFFQDPESGDTCLHRIAREQSIEEWEYFSREVLNFYKLFYTKNHAGNIALFEFVLSPKFTRESLEYIITYCRNLRDYFKEGYSGIWYRRKLLLIQNDKGQTFLHLIACTPFLSLEEKRGIFADLCSNGFMSKDQQRLLDANGKTAWDYLDLA